LKDGNLCRPQPICPQAAKAPELFQGQPEEKEFKEFGPPDPYHPGNIIIPAGT
jgi:hypothetical protein